MAATDYYKTLGVSRTASEKEIKSAFRRLARQYHPDVNPGNEEAERRFKEINEAHEVLGDTESRSRYDKHGENWMHADRIEEMQRQGGFRGGPGMGGGTFRYGSAEGFSGLGDIFGQFFGGGHGGAGFGERRRPAQPQEVAVEVTLQEAYHGARRSVLVPDGNGGTRTLDAQIPAGVETGSRVRMSGAGPRSPNGQLTDLYFKVTVKRDPVFTRKGADLTTEVKVSMYDALLGGEVVVPTIGGAGVALRIPPETENGQTFRITGKGMPRMRESGSGDLLVKANITLPKGLKDSERELLTQLRGMRETAGGGS